MKKMDFVDFVKAVTEIDSMFEMPSLAIVFDDLNRADTWHIYEDITDLIERYDVATEKQVIASLKMPKNAKRDSVLTRLEEQLDYFEWVVGEWRGYDQVTRFVIFTTN